MSKNCCCGPSVPVGPSKEEMFFYALRNAIEVTVAVAMHQRQQVTTSMSMPGGGEFAYQAVDGANDRLRNAITDLFKEKE